MGIIGIVAQQRAAEYGKRLNKACDSNPHCPPLHHGRLTWLRDGINKRIKKERPLRMQSVSRWINGEVTPRADKNDIIAQMLGVDPTWLYFGTETQLAPREAKVNKAVANGAISVIAGLIQMDGGLVSYPDGSEVAAADSHVDLNVVIKGARYALHITTGQQVGNEWKFIIPKVADDVLILAMIRTGFYLHIFELSPPLVEQYASAKNDNLEVLLSEKTIVACEVKDFTKRL